MTRNLLTASSALAALLAAAPAMAQNSSVTIYGLMDAAIDHSRAGNNLTRVVSGAGLGSRLGFRGQEDLGGRAVSPVPYRARPDARRWPARTGRAGMGARGICRSE